MHRKILLHLLGCRLVIIVYICDKYSAQQFAALTHKYLTTHPVTRLSIPLSLYTVVCCGV